MEKPRKSGAENIPRVAALRAPRGTGNSCKGWEQEAALRLLMNSLDPDLAESAESLRPCNDAGAVATDWTAFDAITEALRAISDDETLLVHHGRIAGVLQTRHDAPRVLIADSDPAAGWSYTGPQLFLPQAYEIVASAKKRFFEGDLGGKFVASGGMDGMRAALPLAATMNGAAFLGIDADAERIKRCVKSGYCDVMVNGLDEALRILKNAVRKREAASVGLLGNPTDAIAEMASRGVVPDLLLNLATSKSETAKGLENAVRTLRRFGSIVIRAAGSRGASTDSECKQPREGADVSMAELLGCNLEAGYESVHWVALSGESGDIQRIDRLLLELFPRDDSLRDWIRTLQSRGRQQGLPARSSRLGMKELPRVAAAMNQLVARGEVKAPVAIVWQRLPCLGDQATAGVRGGLVVPDTKQLQALIGLGAGTAWTAVRRDASGGAIVVAKVVVADGSDSANARIERAFGAEV